MLEFKILGPLRVLIDGENVPIEDPVDRALLVGLLLNPNRSVSAVRVLNRLWRGEPRPQDLPDRTVESADRLRRFIAALPGTTRLVRTRGALKLEIDEGLIDSSRARALIDEALNLPVRRRAKLLYRALRLWPETYPDTEAVWAPDLRDLWLRLLRELAVADEAIAAESGSDVSSSSHRSRLYWAENFFESSYFEESTPRPDPPETPHGASPPEQSPSGSGVLTATGTLSVSMYLSDEGAHTAVESAVEAMLATAGLSVVERDDPILGSWFRKVRATDLGAVAAHAADSRLVLAHDAQVTSTMMQNLGPVLTALQPTKEAVLRIGAILVVKLDDQLVVHQLTAAQQLQLDHQPQLAMTPREILTALRVETDERAAQNIPRQPLREIT